MQDVHCVAVDYGSIGLSMGSVSVTVFAIDLPVLMALLPGAHCLGTLLLLLAGIDLGL